MAENGMFSLPYIPVTSAGVNNIITLSVSVCCLSMPDGAGGAASWVTRPGAYRVHYASAYRIMATTGTADVAPQPQSTAVVGGEPTHEATAPGPERRSTGGAPTVEQPDLPLEPPEVSAIELEGTHRLNRSGQSISAPTLLHSVAI